MNALRKPGTAAPKKNFLLRQDPDTPPELISRALNNLCRMLETQRRYQFG